MNNESRTWKILYWIANLQEGLDRYDQINVCSFIRKLVFNFFLLAFVAFEVSMLLVIMILPIFVSTNFAPVSMFLWLGTGIIAIRSCGDIFQPSWNIDIVPRRNKKEPGVFKLWLKAKHDKVCYMIDISK